MRIFGVGKPPWKSGGQTGETAADAVVLEAVVPGVNIQLAEESWFSTHHDHSGSGYAIKREPIQMLAKKLEKVTFISGQSRKTATFYFDITDFDKIGDRK